MPKRPGTLQSKNKPSSSKSKPTSSGGSKPSWMHKGNDEVQKAQERQAASRQKFFPTFFLSDDGDEALIKFPAPLEELVVMVGRHRVANPNRNSKMKYINVTCTGEPDCALCLAGNKASNRWPVLVMDGREFEVTDRDSRKKVKKKNEVKLWEASIQQAEVLQEKIEELREELGDHIDTHNCLWKVVRKGKGSKTRYSFRRVKPIKLSSGTLAKFAAFEKDYGSMTDLLAPPSEEAMQRLVLGANVDDAPSNAPEADVDDVVDEDDVYEDV